MESSCGRTSCDLTNFWDYPKERIGVNGMTLIEDVDPLTGSSGPSQSLTECCGIAFSSPDWSSVFSESVMIQIELRPYAQGYALVLCTDI